MNNEQRDVLISSTHDIVNRLEERLENHITNQVIHQVPPCDAHKTLVSKLWAVVILVLGALISSLYAAFK